MLPLLLLFNSGYPNSASLKNLNNGSTKSVPRLQQKSPDDQSGTLEKMIVANGTVTMDLALNRLNGSDSSSKRNSLRFAVAPNSFFPVLVFNDVLRGPLAGSMALISPEAVVPSSVLQASFNQLVIEKLGWTEPYDIAVRDGKTGFTFFNVEGNLYDYDAKTHQLQIQDGRLLLSAEFAKKLGRPAETGFVIGAISITATMRVIEIDHLVNGEIKAADLPPISGLGVAQPDLVGGPDVIVGDLSGLQQFGSSGTQVGLAVATDSCNAGAEPLHWFQLPNNDHPVIPQNLYRMSGGSDNTDRFEQIGQSWLKHAFTALQQNICGFGCQNSGTGTLLGAGCSDPYSASLNGSQTGLGSRAWVNPFTGAFPGSNPSPTNHSGHTHSGTSHRILVEIDDLNTTLNPGATYYVEAQYITPHEYSWCQLHPGECNMYNNASFRQYGVSGTTSFTFSAVGSTVQLKSAISAWPGASLVRIEPDPGNDGVGFIGFKVTNPSPGVWHYEYVVYNQNLDRAIQSFTVPLGVGSAVNNIGFHAPPQAPGFANDGTVGSAGYSSAPWNVTQASNSISWNSETFAENQNANAVRWGTLYNFRFDSNRPPQNVNATIGFFKTGAPIPVQVQAPATPTSAGARIRGTVIGSSGTPLSGVLMTLSGGASLRRAITDIRGDYSFSDIEVNDFYTVTPLLANYTFAPSLRAFSLFADVTDATFTGLHHLERSNPLDTPEFFVRQQYLDFLGREPDPRGWEYWSEQLRQCGADIRCINRARVAVSNAFFAEAEYRRTGAYVFRLYRAAYGNEQPFPNPDRTDVTEARKIPSYNVFTHDRARVVDGPDLAQQQLALATAMTERPEFLSVYPVNLTGSQFVDALVARIQNGSGVSLLSQRDALVTLFTQGGRGAVLYRLADDNPQTNQIDNRAFVDAEYNRSFVFNEYTGYLRRDSDIGGFLFWLDQLNRLPVRDANIQHTLVCAFITSAEYQRRFSSVVTRSNFECGQ